MILSDKKQFEKFSDVLKKKDKELSSPPKWYRF
jgi:hypothetical protein